MTLASESPDRAAEPRRGGAFAAGDARAPRISVVVPIYNVEDYLEPCLESIAGQTFGDLEVILVDDGSTDRSAEIAEEFAARDGRFRLVTQPNAGLGAARNTGIEAARGEFLAFVDSDDMLPRHAYEGLVRALDRTGSDFASGNVLSLTSAGVRQTPRLARACRQTRLGTHITRFPELIADRTAWNKLFRRSFWDRHRLRFPEGVLYEDTPVTLPAHYLAGSVDVLQQPVYLWRRRPGEDLSITQRRTEPRALRDRVAAVEHVSRFLGEQGFRAAKARYDNSAVRQDLRFFLEVLPSAGDEYRRLFLDVVNGFLDQADIDPHDHPLAIERLKWVLVRRRAMPELLEVLRFEDEELAGAAPIRHRRRWYGDYPYRGDDRFAIPDRLYRLGPELAPVFSITGMRWSGDALRIEGYAYIEMLGAPEPDSQKLQLVARRIGSRLPGSGARLRTEQAYHPEVTAAGAQQLAGLDWSGFVATLDAKRLKRGGRWRQGEWEIGGVLRAGGTTRRLSTARRAPMHAVPAADLAIDGTTVLRAELDLDGELTVSVHRGRSVVRECLLDRDVLQIHGDLGDEPAGSAKLLVSRRDAATTLAFPAFVDRSGPRPAFMARIPLRELTREAEVGDEVGRLEEPAKGVLWDVKLVVGGIKSSPTLDEQIREAVWTVEGREFEARGGENADFALVERSPRVVVEEATWSEEGTLLLRGTYRGGAGGHELVLVRRAGGGSRTVPLSIDAETGRFEARLAPAAIESVAGPRPLKEGVWDLFSLSRSHADKRPVNAILGRDLLPALPLAAKIGSGRFQLGAVAGERPALAVEGDLDDDERGGFRQRRLRTAYYPERRAHEPREAVLYDCFAGDEYSDSPRAIHEELVRRGAPFEHLWVIRNGSCDPPATATPVRALGREYYDAYARARYLVANDHWPDWFVRRADQTCLQTWHGTPAKGQGHALADRPQAVREHRRVLRQRPENWQHVVSAGPAATATLERSFPIGGEVLETGLPRTDLLLSQDKPIAAEALKRRLGIAGRRVVLYAPTYRDQLDYGVRRRVDQLRDIPSYRSDAIRRDGYRLGHLLDLARLRDGLADGDVALFRRHPRILDALPADAAGHVIDVSDLPLQPDLLQVADVLITDYSSSIFDFASTGRPILFFVPDLEAYRDEARGLSIDLEAEAPGPLLRTTEEVVQALREVDAVRGRHRERYDSFAARHGALADGSASARVVERVFSW